MARTRSLISRSAVSVHRYYWPQQQLNLWTFLTLATGGYILGVFADFMSVQSRLQLGTPW